MKLSKRSESELHGVHADLVAVVMLAIQETTQDFTVHDGLRTQAEQAEMLRSGASTTPNSRHLTGHAVDLVPYLNGKLRWEWALIYPIAEAVRTVAIKLEVPIRWGGCWDLELTQTGTIPVEQLVEDYVARRKTWLAAQGKKQAVFIDGPHFELPRRAYP